MKIKSNLTEIGPCNIDVECKVPISEVQSATEKRLANEDSFQISEELVAQVQSDVINTAISEIQERYGLKIIGVPEVKERHYEAGESFSFRASIIVHPRPKINYEIPLVVLQECQEASMDIPSALEELAANPAARVYGVLAYLISDGDMVDVILERKQRNGKYRVPEAKKVKAELSQGADQLSLALVGKTLGTSFEVSQIEEAQVSATTADERVVGLRVFVKAIKNKKRYTVSDELARAFGLKDLPDLKSCLQKQLQNNLGKQKQADLEERVTKVLLSNNKIPVPEELVRHYENVFAKWDRDQIRKFLGEQILFEQIAKQENISLSDEDWEQELARVAIEKGYEYKSVEHLTSNTETFEQLSISLLKRKVVARLVAA